MSIVQEAIDKAESLVIPNWRLWSLGILILAVTAASFYGLGRLHEARANASKIAAAEHKAAIETVRIVKGETEVVTKIDTVYRDRIVKIKEEGVKIENRIPDYIPPVADQHFAVSLGFVRVIDGAWSGAIVGPASDADEQPSGIPLSELAAIEAGNATSCRAWREQVFGWREFYAGQQKVINGKVGEWYVPEE